MNSLNNFVESFNRTVYDFSTLAKSAGVIYIGFALYEYFSASGTDKEWQFKKACENNKDTIYENENFIYCYSENAKYINASFDKKFQAGEDFNWSYFGDKWKKFFGDI